MDHMVLCVCHVFKISRSIHPYSYDFENSLTIDRQMFGMRHLNKGDEQMVLMIAFDVGLLLFLVDVS